MCYSYLYVCFSSKKLVHLQSVARDGDGDGDDGSTSYIHPMSPRTFSLHQHSKIQHICVLMLQNKV